MSGFAREPLAAGAVTAAGVARPDELRRAVTMVLQKAKAGRQNICMSVACETMDAREMEYPVMPERDLLSSIQWDLNQLFGAAVADSDVERLVDYELLHNRERASHGPGEGDAKQAYLVVSAPKHSVYEFLTPLHDARIYPEIVDIGAFSLPWALPRGGGVGYLHLGPELTHFVMLDNGMYELSRQVRLALGPVLHGLADGVTGLGALEEALEAAEAGAGHGAGIGAVARAEVAAGAEPGTAIGAEAAAGLDAGTVSATGAAGRSGAGGATPVGKALIALLRWIDETLEFVRVQSGSFTVEERMQTLVLSGSGATVPGIVPLIQQRTGLQIVAAVPNLAEGGATIPAEEAPTYALAVGLAQRGLSEL